MFMGDGHGSASVAEVLCTRGTGIGKGGTGSLASGRVGAPGASIQPVAGIAQDV